MTNQTLIDVQTLTARLNTAERENQTLTTRLNTGAREVETLTSRLNTSEREVHPSTGSSIFNVLLRRAGVPYC